MTQYLYHDPVVDATLISLNELEVRLKLPADANQVTLNYWNKYKPEYGIRKQAMTLWAESGEFKYYRTILTGMESRIRYLQYKFEFAAKGESYWLGAEGLCKRTLPIALANFQGQYTTQWGIVFAGSLIAVVPIILLFLLLQRYFIAGITAGAVKG
ncbi:alpha amylase N-terminal ig-like domain-containing protein [Paenibacillus barengoltzii]|uniref:alpha amylase N-terminal ig-like domain-containing protein n=1 Tax=Paenibacillus barengoltzii TaxID=343517 RepID=UPI003F8A61DF